MAELDGKVALAVGATRKRGLGRAIATTLAEGGADVAVTGTGRPPSEFPEDEQQEAGVGRPRWRRSTRTSVFFRTTASWTSPAARTFRRRSPRR